MSYVETATLKNSTIMFLYSEREEINLSPEYQRMGGVATLLEWDADIPEFEVVHAEALKARRYREAPAQHEPEREPALAYGD